ncbi:MAG: hypothetical protein ACE5JA_05805 [bacterium]
MTRPKPILTTYELEQMACIFDRLYKANQKELNYTEYYIKDCWAGSDPNWVVSFFAKLVEHAPKMSR